MIKSANKNYAILVNYLLKLSQSTLFKPISEHLIFIYLVSCLQYSYTIHKGQTQQSLSLVAVLSIQ